MQDCADGAGSGEAGGPVWLGSLALCHLSSLSARRFSLLRWGRQRGGGGEQGEGGGSDVCGPTPSTHWQSLQLHAPRPPPAHPLWVFVFLDQESDGQASQVLDQQPQGRSAARVARATLRVKGARQEISHHRGCRTPPLGPRPALRILGAFEWAGPDTHTAHTSACAPAGWVLTSRRCLPEGGSGRSTSDLRGDQGEGEKHTWVLFFYEWALGPSPYSQQH